LPGTPEIHLNRGCGDLPVINCTLGGRFLVEGRARIVRRLGNDRYLVRFPDGDLVDRFVDPKRRPIPTPICGRATTTRRLKAASPVDAIPKSRLASRHLGSGEVYRHEIIDAHRQRAGDVSRKGVAVGCTGLHTILLLFYTSSLNILLISTVT
jgi:hypothetical protein